MVQGSSTASLGLGRPSGPGPLGLKRLVQSSGLVIGARVAGVGIGLVTQLVLARMLSAADLGLFFMAMSLAMVLSTLVTGGYPMMLPGIAAEEARNGGSGKQRQFVRHAMVNIAITSAVLAVPGALAIALWPSVDTGGRLCLALGALAAPLLGLLRLNGSVANAHRRFTLGFVPDLVIRPLLVLAFSLTAWMMIPSAGIATILAAQIPIAATIIAWQRRQIAATRLLGPAPRTPVQPPTAFQRRLWRRQSLAMLAAMVFIAVFADLDLLVAGSLMGNAETGVFGVALKISMLAAFAVQAVHQLIMRDAADAIGHGDMAGLRTVLARANRLCLAISAAGLVVAAAAGEYVLAVFGPEFRSGYACLVILMAAQAIRAGAGPVTQLAALTGQEKACLPLSLAALAVLVVSNVVLIGPFGLVGAALAVALTSGFWSLALAITLRRRAGVDPAVWSA